MLQIPEIPSSYSLHQ